MINVLLQRLQKSSGFCTNLLADAIPHNPTKDLRTTHPHRAICIDDGHLG